MELHITIAPHRPIPDYSNTVPATPEQIEGRVQYETHRYLRSVMKIGDRSLVVETGIFALDNRVSAVEALDQLLTDLKQASPHVIEQLLSNA